MASLEQYSHEALTKAGYTRSNPDPIRGVGFVAYNLDAEMNWAFGASFRQVVFVGNNATMEAWTEEHWKKWPDLHKWHQDPAKQEPYEWREGVLHFTFIKGEDPARGVG